jgi:hypothetical protein
MHGGVEVHRNAFLNSELDDGEWTASRPLRFTPEERAPGTTLITRLGGLKSHSGHSGDEENNRGACRELNLLSSSH